MSELTESVIEKLVELGAERTEDGAKVRFGAADVRVSFDLGYTRLDRQAGYTGPCIVRELPRGCSWRGGLGGYRSVPVGVSPPIVPLPTSATFPELFSRIEGDADDVLGEILARVEALWTCHTRFISVDMIDDSVIGSFALDCYDAPFRTAVLEVEASEPNTFDKVMLEVRSALAEGASALWGIWMWREDHAPRAEALADSLPAPYAGDGQSRA